MARLPTLRSRTWSFLPRPLGEVDPVAPASLTAAHVQEAVSSGLQHVASTTEDAGERQPDISSSLDHTVQPDGEFSDFADLELGNLLKAEAVTSAASKSAMRSVEAPSVITVITRETIGARGYRSIGEARASVAGLYVVDNHVGYDVTVRGVSGGPDFWSRIIKVLSTASQ